MRSPSAGNRFPPRLRLSHERFCGGVLVAFVQRVVRALHKDFTPFYQAGGQEPSDHADDHLLEERVVHAVLKAFGVPFWAACSPKSPLPRLHDPEAEEQVRNCVRKGTRQQTFGAISDEVVKPSGNQRGGPICHRMPEGKGERDDDER